MNNFKKVVTMVLAFAMVLTCVMVTPAQAAGKLNKATASIYEGETVQLKAKVKSVTWGSSNKKVAKVSKTGLVTGVKKGTCTITAKDNKTKTASKCKVTVKAAKSFGFTAKDIYVATGGDVITYPGKAIKDATYVLDGNAYVVKIDGVEVTPLDSTGMTGDGSFVVDIDATNLTPGQHTVLVTSEGIPDGETTITIE